jgi:hypothetical protein
MCKKDAREFFRASLTIMPNFTTACAQAALARKSAHYDLGNVDVSSARASGHRMTLSRRFRHVPAIRS